MRAVLMIIADIIGKQPPQVVVIQSDHVIQQVPAAALDPALRNPVLPRTLDRSANTLDSHRSNRGGNLRAILGIPIKDKKPGSGLIRKGFAQLLYNPQACRMWCDVKVQDATAIVADDKKAVEHTESDRLHGEEVHRRDCFPMVAEKCKPAFRRLGISWCFAHPTGDGSLGKIKSEHEKFTMNPGCSPRRIFGDHFEDQTAHLLRDSMSATAWAPSSRQNTPVQLKSRSVPLNNGFRTDEDERLVPAGPDLPGGDPEQFVE